jgi:hypothetical protein
VRGAWVSIGPTRGTTVLKVKMIKRAAKIADFMVGLLINY